jgi:CO/xanthine dehydrogenase Mo-binding subunit
MSGARAPAVAGSLRAGDRIDKWLRIEDNGAITVLTGKVELGQGIHAALAGLVAEELDVPFERVAVAPVDTAHSPDEGFTAGSRSIQDSGMALRQAAAEARRALLDAAASRLGVEADQLVIVEGVIVAPDGRRTTYAELAIERPFAQAVRGDVTPKPAGERRLVGHDMPRRDLRRKITGRPAFLQDVELPGMLHGRILRPPSYGSSLVSFDDAIIGSLPGVRTIVRDGSFVGIIAEREDQALRALTKASAVARWDETDARPLELGPTALPDLATDEVEVEVVGERAPDAAVRTISAEYSRLPIAHGSVGPSCAVAHLESGRYTVRTHSQGIFALRHELARVLEADAQDVRVIHVEGAGCYGHNGADDAALDAALLARAVPGRPVRVQWMRDDEFAWEPFGPAMLIRLEASLDDDGGIVGWRHDGWSPGHSARPSADRRGRTSGLLAARHLAMPWDQSRPRRPRSPIDGGQRNAIPAYHFPYRRVVDHFVPDTSLRVSALRSLGAHANVFAIESFMDEIASATALDPIELRLSYLEDERARTVLRASAELAGWQPGATSHDDVGRGVGYARYKNAAAYAAVIAEVEVGTEVRVSRVWAAIDAGMVVSRDGLLNQAEGGIVQAVSWTLHEAVRAEGPAIGSRGWDSYRTLRFSEVPEVRVTVIDRPDLPPLGAGEAMAGPTAAAIANAIHDAIGLRARDLPLTREHLVKAIG